jgi:ATP-dependent RNA helicase HelY
VIDVLRRMTEEPLPDEPGAGGAGADLDARIAAHSVAECPDLTAHLKAAASLDRVARDAARLQRRVRGRSESLARQFDRVLRVLESWGYVDGFALTDAGRLLTRIYCETDLLLAETLRTGGCDGLTPAELAALVCCFTYERRGPEGARPLPPAAWPTSRVAKRYRELERTWRDLSANEDDAGLPETRSPDPGLAAAMHAWAAGEELAGVLEQEEDLTGGDFVRHVKQVIDLLHQLSSVAPNPQTAAAARDAADACFRGVVAASSLVG